MMHVVEALSAIVLTVSTCSAISFNISGTVKDPHGDGVSQASVVLKKEGRFTTTGENGFFMLTDTSSKTQRPNPFSRPQKAIVFIRNGRLIISALNPSKIEISAFNVRGQAVFTVQKEVSQGEYSLILPHKTAGTCIYKIKMNGEEVVFKGISMRQISFTQGGFQQRSSKGSSAVLQKTGEASEFNDVLEIVKYGYLDYSEQITSNNLSGMEIHLIKNEGTITDIDGNKYQTVRIGNQIWTVENFRTTRYNDGTPITFDTSNTSWGKSSTGKYCYVNNTIDPDSIKRFGAFYNWYAVSSDKFSPEGWHVPSEAEWDTLISSLNNNEIARSIAAKTDWEPSQSELSPGNDLSINNFSGFSAIATGYRNFDDGSFCSIGKIGNWWCSDQYDSISAANRFLNYDNPYLNRNSFNKNSGLSVRLIQNYDTDILINLENFSTIAAGTELRIRGRVESNEIITNVKYSITDTNGDEAPPSEVEVLSNPLPPGKEILYFYDDLNASVHVYASAQHEYILTITAEAGNTSVKKSNQFVVTGGSIN